MSYSYCISSVCRLVMFEPLYGCLKYREYYIYKLRLVRLLFETLFELLFRLHRMLSSLAYVQPRQYHLILQHLEPEDDLQQWRWSVAKRQSRGSVARKSVQVSRIIITKAHEEYVKTHVSGRNPESFSTSLAVQRTSSLGNLSTMLHWKYGNGLCPTTRTKRKNRLQGHLEDLHNTC